MKDLVWYSTLTCVDDSKFYTFLHLASLATSPYPFSFFLFWRINVGFDIAKITCYTEWFIWKVVPLIQRVGNPFWVQVWIFDDFSNCCSEICPVNIFYLVLGEGMRYVNLEGELIMGVFNRYVPNIVNQVMKLWYWKHRLVVYEKLFWEDDKISYFFHFCWNSTYSIYRTHDRWPFTTIMLKCFLFFQRSVEEVERG